jgi:hypothetical protein
VQRSRLEKLRESKCAEAARTMFAANWSAMLQDYKALQPVVKRHVTRLRLFP